MTKTETIFDLIARALGMTDPDNLERLQGYLDLYAATLINSQAVEETSGKSQQRVEESTSGAPAGNQMQPSGGSIKTDIAAANSKHFAGEGAGEKKSAFARLNAYREKHGLGCYKTIAAAAKGALSVDEIRDMCNASPYHISKWRALAAALDAVESVAG